MTLKQSNYKKMNTKEQTKTRDETSVKQFVNYVTKNSRQKRDNKKDKYYYDSVSVILLMLFISSAK